MAGARNGEGGFEEAGEVEPQLRGLSEARVVATEAGAMNIAVAELRGPGRRRDLSQARAMAGYIGKRLGGISRNRMARYFHRDGSTLVRDIGQLEQRLTKDAGQAPPRYCNRGSVGRDVAK